MLSLKTRWAIHKMNCSRRKLERLEVICNQQRGHPLGEHKGNVSFKTFNGYYDEDDVIDVEYVEIN